MTAAQQESPGHRWLILAALCVVALINQGMAQFGAPIMNTHMARSLSLDRASLGFLLSIYMLSVGAASLVLAGLEARLGIKRTMILGNVILLLAAGGMALFVQSSAGAAAFYGVGIGSAIILGGQLPAQAIAATWFERNRTLAFSVIGASIGIGGALAPPALNWLIGAVGNWRIGWSALAGMAAISLLLAILFGDVRKNSAGEANGGAHDAPAARLWTVSAALRTSAAWLIFCAELGPTIGFHIFLGHGFPHLSDLGYSSAKAAGAMSVVTLAFIAGNAIIGLLGDRIGVHRAWAAINILFALGMALIAKPAADWQLYLATFCLGAGFGGSVIGMMTLLANYFGPATLLGLSGIAVAVQMAFGAAAPPLAGAVYDQTHDYSLAFFAAAGIALLGAVILLLRRQPSPSPQPSPIVTPRT